MNKSRFKLDLHLVDESTLNVTLFIVGPRNNPHHVVQSLLTIWLH